MKNRLETQPGATPARKDIPQPGESTGRTPLTEGTITSEVGNIKIELEIKLVSSGELSLAEILTSEDIDQSSIPYYKEVHDDIKGGNSDWGVTKKVKEYADYLFKHPETAESLPPLQFLNGKLHDGAHRISTLYLLNQLHPEGQWDKVKLRVDFYEGEVKE